MEINTPMNVEMYLPSPRIVDEVGGDWCTAEVNPRVPNYVAEMVRTSGELQFDSRLVRMGVELKCDEMR